MGNPSQYTLYYFLLFVLIIISILIIPVLIEYIDKKRKEAKQKRYREEFYKHYKIHVPPTMLVYPTTTTQDIGIFRMRYPTWERRNKDGTHDGRSNNMRIHQHSSELFIGQWQLAGSNPFVVYNLILQLRAAGVAIAYCAEEQRKRETILRRMNTRYNTSSIDAIVEQFSDDPVKFEPFCADMFRYLGWQASVTPPSRDGGFDLTLCDTNGNTFIAECKCYNRKHRIGRHVLQKLQGANATQLAQGTIFITTSDFTADAIAYARQVDMRLIDGATLIRLCREAYETEDIAKEPHIDASACHLTRQDIMRHIPIDMQYRYG
ncbi:restriction endonuclease [Bifidobacterium pseudolongum]|uniref:Restriction endonuclease n=1 Tax=Bifidobacterium pseudolongum TaxID=1694 RepID=A0A4S4F6M0_9BIFI|nr:restriction endonuclease [Bifidobacterium pseudolongum]THG24455.1 restriction endonuclease [Bifidobacterium pseudolongum]